MLQKLYVILQSELIYANRYAIPEPSCCVFSGQLHFAWLFRGISCVSVRIDKLSALGFAFIPSAWFAFLLLTLALSLTQIASSS